MSFWSEICHNSALLTKMEAGRGVTMTTIHIEHNTDGDRQWSYHEVLDIIGSKPNLKDLIVMVHNPI